VVYRKLIFAPQQTEAELDEPTCLRGNPIDRANPGHAVCANLTSPSPRVVSIGPRQLGRYDKVRYWVSFVAHDMHVEQHSFACQDFGRQPVGDNDDRLARCSDGVDCLLGLPLVIKDGVGDCRPAVGQS